MLVSLQFADFLNNKFNMHNERMSISAYGYCVSITFVDFDN